ncbi:MAG: SDR family NAD(P)-dependent oxidoreductase [Saprospiraceae bacterium]|nr:SDR family NAD(P)-dependent oxidoreductase [Saprospiraceae bacterium]
MANFKTKYGPWAFVAGASEGLGAAFAEALASRGLNLILIARRKEKLEDLALVLRQKFSVEIQYASIDLADIPQTINFVEGLRMDIGLLVYNAAYAPIGYFQDIPEGELLKIVDVNIRTPLILSKLLSGRMAKKRTGGIILMSSLAGNQGSPKIATYAASKAFNLILAEGLWSELKDQGIDVIASCAGAIRTPGYLEAEKQKDAPGTLDADQVVSETLAALGNGPSVTPGLTNKIARFFMGRLIPKKAAIFIMKKNTKNLS